MCLTLECAWNIFTSHFCTIEHWTRIDFQRIGDVMMLDLGFKFFTELREKWHFEQSRSFKRMELKDSKMEEEIAVWTGR